MTDSEKSARLTELEQIWRARFVQQPKLPSSALLTGAVAMATGFGAALFLIGAVLKGYTATWIALTCVFAALSLACGLTNRILARRWYAKQVVPWGDERKALKIEIDKLRGK